MALDEGYEGHPAAFATTHWSVVLAAGVSGGESSSDALEQLCRTYWYPLYAYVRRMGRSKVEAQDLTQAFFAELLAKNHLGPASPERGRFRSFLLTMFKRFLADEWHASQAQKRGGGQILLSLDDAEGEERFLREAAHNLTPEKLYEQSWAVTLLRAAEAQLRDEHSAAGKEVLFEHLKLFLSGDRAAMTHAEAGALLGMEAGAVKVAVHRLRRRYRECLRMQIAQTVSSATELEDEIRSLFAAFQA